MSREIKFRAWDKEDKKYLLPEEQGFVILPTKPSFGVTIPFQSEHYPNENLDIDCVDWADADLLMGRYELEQYTGLKDKNGKEIYEGDIIEEEIDFNSKMTDGTFSYKVYWNEDELCWSLEPIGSESIHNDLWETNSSRRVIGNVHEPPKDFRPEHLKRMGVSISKGGEEYL